MKTVRYFHIRPLVKRQRKFVPNEKGGATVRVESGDTIGMVSVGYVVCSAKDNFVKETGRVLAAKASIENVPLRYLGGMLSTIAEEVEQVTKGVTEDTDYHFAMRYFLPK